MEPTESELRRLYLEEGLTETEIANRFGTYQVQINRLRTAYGIETLLKSDRLDLPDVIKGRLRSILIGSMLGDGGLSPTGSETARYTEHHCTEQRPYLDWKAAEWGDFVSSIGPADKDGHPGFRMVTHGCRALHSYWKTFYPSGEGDKVFTGLDPEMVDGLALAVWFQDDGSKTSNGYVRFHVTPSEPCQRVLLDVLSRFGFKPSLYAYEGDVCIWLHDQLTMTRFLDLVTPYIHPCMRYKIELLERARGPAARDILTPECLVEHAGKSAAELSRATGVSASSAWRALNSEEPTGERNVEGLTEPTLRQLYEVNLLSDRQVALRFAVSDVLCSQMRKRFGIDTISHREREERLKGCTDKLSDLTKERLAELYRTMSDSEIAVLYGTSKVTIRNYRHKFGIAAVSKTERVRSRA